MIELVIPNFYSLLATSCYGIVTYNLIKQSKYILSISFGSLTIFYFILQIAGFNEPSKYSDFVWGLFNVLIAVFIMHLSNQYRAIHLVRKDK